MMNKITKGVQIYIIIGVSLIILININTKYNEIEYESRKAKALLSKYIKEP